MKISFTKMQGAGNDFVVLDETQGQSGLTKAQYRWLADRHFGVGADQILTVRRAPAGLAEPVDFEYVIHNADGGEVEQCGNGARCFARYVFDKHLSEKKAIRVSTRAGIIEPQLQDDGRVTVNMGLPRWDHAEIPFISAGLQSDTMADTQRWWLPLPKEAGVDGAWIVAVSMGNPHAVQVVESAEHAPVLQSGPWLESHASFPQRVNAGFMEVQSRSRIALRVYERGAGETLACGTGACAAVVSGIALGLLDSRVDVHTKGGVLTIEWAGAGSPVMMTGPALTVFEGTIDIPASP